MSWTENLLNWYEKNKRNLPWRSTKDPYTIWLSEIILQQTRIAQGLPYFNKFIQQYPTVEALANAKESQVLKLWEGLGYYSRARNMHFTARYITEELEGVFPSDFKSILTLKGVGDYTASAIASFCYDIPEPVVDGNVYRFFTRFFGIKTPINTSKTFLKLKEIGKKMMQDYAPSIFNQAIMEFGANQCTPNPNCEKCIFISDCWAYNNNYVKELPTKIKKKKIMHRFFNYLVFNVNDDKTILKQRVSKDIWYNLYEFPLIESSKAITKPKLIEEPSFKNLVNNTPYKIAKHNSKAIIHKLSHQNLYVYFWIIKVPSTNQPSIKIYQINEYPFPVVLKNFIKDYFN